MKAILMSGVAGAGKTTWAHKYAETHPHTAVISSDDIRYEHFLSYVVSKNQEEEVQQIIRERIKEVAEQHLDLVLDVACVLNRYRHYWAKELRKYYRIVDLVYLDMSLDECIDNDGRRLRHVPEHVIRDMYFKRQRPNKTTERLFDSITIIRNREEDGLYKLLCLERIENKIGFSLETLFEAFDDEGIYERGPHGAVHTNCYELSLTHEFHSNEYEAVANDTTIYEGYELGLMGKDFLSFEDYGKEWAITKEEL